MPSSAPHSRTHATPRATLPGPQQEPWYKLLLEWEEMELDDDEDVDASGNTAEVEALVRRDAADSFSVVNFHLSRHDARWLIDSIAITE